MLCLSSNKGVLLLYRIPLLNEQGATFIKVAVVVDETNYILEFMYNTTLKTYVASIYTNDYTPIITGYTARIGWPLFYNITNENLPSGYFIFLSVLSDYDYNQYITSDKIGISQLLYYEDGEDT